MPLMATAPWVVLPVGGMIDLVALVAEGLLAMTALARDAVGRRGRSVAIAPVAGEVTGRWPRVAGVTESGLVVVAAQAVALMGERLDAVCLQEVSGMDVARRRCGVAGGALVRRGLAVVAHGADGHRDCRVRLTGRGVRDLVVAVGALQVVHRDMRLVGDLDAVDDRREVAQLVALLAGGVGRLVDARCHVGAGAQVGGPDVLALLQPPDDAVDEARLDVTLHTGHVGVHRVLPGAAGGLHLVTRCAVAGRRSQPDGDVEDDHHHREDAYRSKCGQPPRDAATNRRGARRRRRRCSRRRRRVVAGRVIRLAAVAFGCHAL